MSDSNNDTMRSGDRIDDGHGHRITGAAHIIPTSPPVSSQTQRTRRTSSSSTRSTRSTMTNSMRPPKMIRNIASNASLRRASTAAVSTSASGVGVGGGGSIVGSGSGQGGGGSESGGGSGMAPSLSLVFAEPEIARSGSVSTGAGGHDGSATSSASSNAGGTPTPTPMSAQQALVMMQSIGGTSGSSTATPGPSNPATLRQPPASAPPVLASVFEAGTSKGLTRDDAATPPSTSTTAETRPIQATSATSPQKPADRNPKKQKSWFSSLTRSSGSGARTALAHAEGQPSLSPTPASAPPPSTTPATSIDRHAPSAAIPIRAQQQEAPASAQVEVNVLPPTPAMESEAVFSSPLPIHPPATPLLPVSTSDTSSTSTLEPASTPRPSSPPRARRPATATSAHQHPHSQSRIPVPSSSSSASSSPKLAASPPRSATLPIPSSPKATSHATSSSSTKSIPIVSSPLSGRASPAPARTGKGSATPRSTTPVPISSSPRERERKGFMPSSPSRVSTMQFPVSPSLSGQGSGQGSGSGSASKSAASKTPSIKSTPTSPVPSLLSGGAKKASAAVSTSASTSTAELVVTPLSSTPTTDAPANAAERVECASTPASTSATTNGSPSGIGSTSTSTVTSAGGSTATATPVAMGLVSAVTGQTSVQLLEEAVRKEAVRREREEASSSKQGDSSSTAALTPQGEPEHTTSMTTSAQRSGSRSRSRTRTRTLSTVSSIQVPTRPPLRPVTPPPSYPLGVGVGLGVAGSVVSPSASASISSITPSASTLSPSALPQTSAVAGSAASKPPLTSANTNASTATTGTTATTATNATTSSSSSFFSFFGYTGTSAQAIEEERPPVYVASERRHAGALTGLPDVRLPVLERQDTRGTMDSVDSEAPVHTPPMLSPVIPSAGVPSAVGVAGATLGSSTRQVSASMPTVNIPSSSSAPNTNTSTSHSNANTKANFNTSSNDSPLLSPPLEHRGAAESINPSASRFAIALPLIRRWVGASGGSGTGVSGVSGVSGGSGVATEGGKGKDVARDTVRDGTEDVKEGSNVDAAVEPPTTAEISSATSTQDAVHEGSSAAKTSSSAQDAGSSSDSGSHVHEASWWDYVAWLGQSGATTVAVSASTHLSSVPEQSSDEQTPQVMHTDVPPEGRQPDGEEITTHAPDVKPTSDVDPVSSQPLKGPGAYSSPGTWYLSWPWSSTEHLPSSALPSQSSDSSTQRPTEEQLAAADAAIAQREKEEEIEKLAGELRAMDAAAQSASSSGDAPHDEVNPVSAMIDTSKYGWASFFTSRSLMMKRLGYGADSNRLIDNVKRDENGMEVMDLDFDDDSAVDSAPPDASRGRSADTKQVLESSSGVVRSTASTPARVLSPVPITKASSGRNTSSAQTNSGANSASSSLKSRLSVVPPPLTVSADVKRDSAKLSPNQNGKGSTTSTPRRGNSGTNTPVPPSPSTSTSNSAVARPLTSTEPDPANGNGGGSRIVPSALTTKRTSSPAPSSKSSKAPPSAPPPNLVLPTWQDTFHTPPRNVLPPKPEVYADDQGVGGKLFGKTMKFMSNVLFSKEGSSESSRLGSSSGGTAQAKGKGRERLNSRDGSSSRGRSHQDHDIGTPAESLIERDRRERFKDWGKDLPKAWHVFEEAGYDTSHMGHGQSLGPFPPPMQRSTASDVASSKADAPLTADAAAEMKGMKDVLRGCRRVVVIGVHGWFPGAMMRTVLGEPTGTSPKFANMMEQALLDFAQEHNATLEKITKIPLEGEGTIEKRVERLYANLKANDSWMDDLHEADVVIVATHSQGSVVSTHLLDRLIRDNHIVTSRNQSLSNSVVQAVGSGAELFPSSIGLNGSTNQTGMRRQVQRVCCLALCGIHHGPLRYLNSSTLVGPYIQYFESAAARELFEFQNTESAVSQAYVSALQNVLDHGTKVVYVASLNDQVVPIYSGLFTAVSHPLILRALYIDGDAYHSSDFLSKLLVLLLRIRNAGIPDSGLLTHLSEATAGSLNGIGHSTAYEELATFSLAVKYLFLTNEGMAEHTKMAIEPFNAAQEQNDYEIPWSLRDIIADERVAYFFSREISELRDAFREWHPKTTILRDLKRKLQPIQRLPSSFSITSNASKL